MSLRVESVQKYEPGDWIVHCHHGVGRIEAAERKRMGGKETTYFRIEMTDSMIWIPVKTMDDGKIRSVAKKTDFQQAIEVLTRQPGEMDSNINVRRARINNVITENKPITTARLVRDMFARKQTKGTLNETERRAYRTLYDRLIHEWAVCMEIEVETAAELLDQLLRNGPKTGLGNA
jgi:RNA polymerase-interacting CarD/CdnL/TRCF family regulator